MIKALTAAAVAVVVLALMTSSAYGCTKQGVLCNTTAECCDGLTCYNDGYQGGCSSSSVTIAGCNDNNCQECSWDTLPTATCFYDAAVQLYFKYQCSSTENKAYQVFYNPNDCTGKIDFKYTYDLEQCIGHIYPGGRVYGSSWWNCSNAEVTVKDLSSWVHVN